MSHKTFFAGLEEVFARFSALFLTLLFFVIYATSRTEIVMDWYRLAGHLLVFWVVYEALSFVFFEMFKFFSKAQAQVQAANQQNTLQTPDSSTEQPTAEPEDK